MIYLSRTLIATTLLLVLALAVACGAAATPTPVAKAPAAPAAAAPIPTKAPVAGAPAATVTPIPVAKPAATPAPAVPPKAKVERLRIAISPPIHETPLAWMGTGVDANLQSRNFAEPLIETDRKTGAMIPGLAAEWQMSPDGKTWTFKLRKGVPFHGAWGQFTAADVPHTIAMIIQKGALATDTFLLQQLLGKTEEQMRQNVQTPDDHTVVFKLLRPEADMDFNVSAQQGNLLIYSKAQFDKEGTLKDGIKWLDKPVGTGPWQFVEQQLGQYLLFKRVENHWRKTPEFKELQLLRVPEASTRLAMSLAGEAHISEVDKELHKEAVAKGLKVANSVLPAVQLAFIMGGVYRSDLPDRYDPSVPFLNVKVREAINRSVNRKELIDTVLGGQAWAHPNWGYHSSLPGWNLEWEKQFEKKYGFDPVRARQALNEAGYPEGFATTVVITSIPGAPEMIPAAEAMLLYLNKIGIKAKTQEIEWAKVRELYRTKKTHNLLYPIRGTYRTPVVTLRFYNVSGKEGFISSYEDKLIDEKYAQLVNSVNRAERERLLTEIGDIKFNSYAEVPIAWLPGQMVVNPKIVAEYIFPGNIISVFTHFEYVKAAQ